MAVRQVVTYPARVLKRPAATVGDLREEHTVLAQDLVDTMYAAPGCVGLAAPQLGEPVRAFALDVSIVRKPPPDNHGLVVLFDPEVVLASGAEVKREGCMSVPDFTCDIRRATAVVVRGRGPDGLPKVLEAEGFEARAFQHEIDHLTGLLVLDRVAAKSDVFPRKRYAQGGRHLR